MVKKPIKIPSLSDVEMARIISANMMYPGLSHLFGHFSPGYIKYIVSAMDSYTWFRYVEAESKSHILKQVATKTLYRMMNRGEQANICSGNENGYVIGSSAVGFSSRGVNYKAINEDGIGIFERDNELALVACDGVGDCLVGEVASFVILDIFDQQPQLSLQESLEKACQKLTQLSRELAKEIPEFVTFPNEVSQAAATAVRIKGNRCEIAQVGDVILFVYRDGDLTMLDPHGDWLSVKQLTELFANEKYLSQRHIITNAIGRNYDPNWETVEFDLKDDDLIVLASDGLETLHPRTLQAMLGSERDLTQLLDLLYDKVIKTNLAWQTPGSPIYTKPDNISVILYRHKIEEAT